MDAYIGEIRLFAGNFAPYGWAFCNGQELSIARYQALFSLLGTTYGGNGTSTFAVPDLKGRAPMHWGQGPGLSARAQGQQIGSSGVTLGTAQIPSHNHLAMAVDAQGTASGPTDACWAQFVARREVQMLYGSGSQLTQMSPQALDVAGGSQPHNNLQPYLGLNFIICLDDGEYPARP